MRRPAIALGALAFLWSSAATLYVLLGSSGTAMSASNLLAWSGAEPTGIPSVATANGVWMAALLMAVTLLTSLPAGVALRDPSRQRAVAWATGLMVFGFSLVSGAFPGLLFLPSAIVLMAAGALDRVEPGTSSPSIVFEPLV